MAQSPPSVVADDDTPMGRSYVLVLVCEAAVVTFLWWFGRAFSA